MMNQLEQFKRGVQVIYVPDHAEGWTGHEDCQEGFVTSVKGETIFCRYWSKSNYDELRTKSASEGCSYKNLRIQASRTPLRVFTTLDAIKAEEAREQRAERIGE